MGRPNEAHFAEPFTLCAYSAKASHERCQMLQQTTGDVNHVPIADSPHVWRRWIPSKASSSHADGSGLIGTIYSREKNEMPDIACCLAWKFFESQV